MNEGVPADVLRKWADCRHHDFETSCIGMAVGVYLLKCVKCGCLQRTDAAVWSMLNRLETIP